MFSVRVKTFRDTYLVLVLGLRHLGTHTLCLLRTASSYLGGALRGGVKKGVAKWEELPVGVSFILTGAETVRLWYQYMVYAIWYLYIYIHINYMYVICA